MNETFKSVTPYEKENEDIRKRTKNNINIAESIDFDFIIDSLPKGLIDKRTITKKTKDKLVMELAKMGKNYLLVQSVEVDKDALYEAIYKQVWYESTYRIR